MTNRSIVFATDLSSRCDRALDRAIMLATERSARLIIVHAMQDPPEVAEHPSSRHADTLAATRRRAIEDVGRQPGIAIDIVVERAEPAELILHTAQRYGSELIVTGMARDAALGRVLLGTTVDALAYRAPAPVLIVKARPRSPYQSAVIATDFSESSRNALETTLALLPAASITLFHAFSSDHQTHGGNRTAARNAMRHQAEEECRSFIAATPAAAAHRARITYLCEDGDLSRSLLVLVDAQDLPLVVLGTSGHSGLAGFLLGNTGLRLATAIPVDVLLVRRQTR